MATNGDISDLDTLLFGGKPLIPLRPSYRLTNPNGVIQTQIAGGASRQRKKFFNGTYLVSSTYELDEFALDWIQVFFQKNEGKKFIAHLAADRPIVEPYVVQVVSEWQFPDYSGFRGQLTVEYEVFQARNQCLDNFLYEVYPCWGSDIGCVLSGFGEIVERMPNAN